MGMFLNGLIKCDTSREEYVKSCVINEAYLFYNAQEKDSLLSIYSYTRDLLKIVFSSPSPSVRPPHMRRVLKYLFGSY